MQHPIYRGRIGGTIYFEVEKYTSYETLQVYLKAENYTIRNVEPLSSRKEKRLAVFVMISEKYCAEKQLALITKEIVSYVRNLNVFSTAVSETKFKNMSARAVWCYFGHDESDMVNHRYFARSIWACDRSGKKKYYSEQKNSSIIRGIWVTTDSFMNPCADFSNRNLPERSSSPEFRKRYARLHLWQNDILQISEKLIIRQKHFRNS